MWYWYNDRQTDEKNRTESTETSPQIYRPLMYNKGGIMGRGRIVEGHWGKSMNSEQLDTHMEKNEINSYSHSIQKSILVDFRPIK